MLGSGDVTVIVKPEYIQRNVLFRKNIRIRYKDITHISIRCITTLFDETYFQISDKQSSIRVFEDHKDVFLMLRLLTANGIALPSGWLKDFVALMPGGEVVLYDVNQTP